MSTEVVSIPRSAAEKLRAEASKLGLSLEEYLVELAVQNLDPPTRAREYIDAAGELLEQARDELKKGDAGQAAEKLWGAASLTIKAYAAWREGKKLSSHGELWEYKNTVEKELGGWVYDAWMAANGIRTCFYEGWCSAKDVEQAAERIERLAREAARRLKK